MISGEPRITENDGTAGHDHVLVDATGEELVCRRRGRGTHGMFHRIDPDRYERDGTIRPACHCTGCDDDNWRSQRRSELNASWNECDYQQCYGASPTQDAPHRFDARTLRAEIAAESDEMKKR